jgi:predicted phage terminase large subunit-like protein
LIVGGSRSGKTFLLTRATVVRATRAPESRHTILRRHYAACKQSIGADTLPKVLKLVAPEDRWQYLKQEGYFQNRRNGSEIWLGGLDDAERVEKILGKEYATIYFNETSQILYSSILVARTRLAQKVEWEEKGQLFALPQRAYYDLNPTGTGHWTYKQFVEKIDPDTKKPLPDPSLYAHCYINPYDNRDNLDPAYLAELEAMPEKQRRRFLEGRYVAEIDGALWTLEMFEANRKGPDDPLPDMVRVVVAVDPSGCSGKEDYRSDEVGITVAGLGTDGRGYLLADYSGRMSPEQWGRKAVQAAITHGADAWIGEDNFGGDMVRSVIETQAKTGCFASYKSVKATRGKVVRAEPVAGLYERNMVSHVGTFPALEDQMTNFSTAGYQGSRSPDRADSAIWALSELMIKPTLDYTGWV